MYGLGLGACIEERGVWVYSRRSRSMDVCVGHLVEISYVNDRAATAKY